MAVPSYEVGRLHDIVGSAWLSSSWLVPVCRLAGGMKHVASNLDNYKEVQLNVIPVLENAANS